MLININRFTGRGLKGIRKGDAGKTVKNLTIALNWTCSLANQLDIDLEKQVWERFPYLCLYCGSCPCACRLRKAKKRMTKKTFAHSQPRTLRGLQDMFGDIYPPASRTLEHAGIHLAEEVGELSEAVMGFRGRHTQKDFENIKVEAADVFSCFMGIFNSLKFDYHEYLISAHANGCYSCRHLPCTCEYRFVMSFKS
ncbi:MAG: hypothetical protein QOE22_649 [Candidatus Parcubacteria bacterium]|jgi:NTP pyrophosphatase (non-canonical NTP hydrolase)|nr:hypothetical protein [Candidatus Parcubacteria bacterium]